MSDSNALRLERLRVRRTPGISDPFELDGLSAGVNLIHGPNASGKTSTARALEAILWPRRESVRPLTIRADYRFAGQRYAVDLDAGRVVVQRDGVDSHPPELPAPELLHRYRLSLHDLLLASDAKDGFAEAIAKQSQGGVDLPGAAKALEFRVKASTAQKELAAVESARNSLKLARGKQEALYAEARGLIELEERCAQAKAARLRSLALDKAIKHAKAATRAAEAQARLAELPSVLQHLHGDEHERFRKLSEQLESATAAERSAKQTLTEAQEAAAHALPSGRPPEELIHALKNESTALAQLQQELERVEREVSKAETELLAARRAMGTVMTDQQLEAIDGATLGRLAAFLRTEEDVVAQVAAADAELARAGDGAAPGDLNALRNGIQLLTRWLENAASGEDQNGSRAQRRTLALVVGALALIGWGLAGLWHPGAWIGAFAMLVALFLMIRADAVAPDARAAREQDYARLDLPRPHAWTREHVGRLLNALQETLAKGAIAEERAIWHREAQRRRQEVEADRATIEAARAEIARSIGVAPDTDARLLRWLVGGIGRWHGAWQEKLGSEDQARKASAQHAQKLTAAATRLEPFGLLTPTNASDLAGCVSALEERVNRYDRAIDRQREAATNLTNAEEQQRRLKTELKELCVRAALSIEDDRISSSETLETLHDLCAKHAEYQEAAEAKRMTSRDVDSARAALEAEGERGLELIGVTLGALEEALGEAASRAEESDGLVAQAAALRARIGDAKSETDVERALAEVANAELALAEARRRDLHAMVGHALVGYIQKKTQDQHRPAVFHRARELFAEITNGSYELEFHDGENGATPTFRAIDTRTRLGHWLDELSSATRVQLLLAVRVAFVETQEQGGARLPLFLDETLGTSDDYRARAIINAVITLAREGRQIFYFTAQRDEVAKWKAALAESGVDHSEFDLAKTRWKGVADGLPLVMIPATLFPVLPSLAGHTHASYGAALGVPRVEPAAGSAAATHLWYLIDDLGALHHLLSFGVSTWGQLELLVDRGGEQILSDHPHVLARARALARVLDAMHEQAAIGVGRTVHRGALLASGAVSPVKIDEVADLAAHHNGSASLLMAALDRREVKHLQQAKIQELREYLEQYGHLDMRPPRSVDEIRLTMLGAAMPDVHAGTLAAADVDLLLMRVARDAGASPRPETRDSVVAPPDFTLSPASAATELPA